MKKQCIGCKKIKTINEFHKNKSKKDGFHSYCKKCRKEYSKEYYKDNKEKLNKKNREWVINNPKKAKENKKRWYKNNLEITKERSKQRRENKHLELKEYFKEYYKNNSEKKIQNAKQWRLNNPEKVKESRKKTYRKIMKNPTLRLSKRISCLIRYSLKGNKNGNHWEIIVDYTLQDLKKHLEKQFKHGMNWDKFLKGEIHIDHIKPISSFNFNFYKDKEFKECWALENLQPLWAEDNIKKGNKF